MSPRRQVLETADNKTYGNDFPASGTACVQRRNTTTARHPPDVPEQREDLARGVIPGSKGTVHSREG